MIAFVPASIIVLLACKFCCCLSEVGSLKKENNVGCHLVNDRTNETWRLAWEDNFDDGPSLNPLMGWQLVDEHGWSYPRKSSINGRGFTFSIKGFDQMGPVRKLRKWAKNKYRGVVL